MNTTMHIIKQLEWSLCDTKDNRHIDFDKENNDKDPKFQVVDHVKISKYKKIFAKRYAPNWSGEFFYN